MSEKIFLAAILVLGIVAARGEFSRQTVYVLVEGKTASTVVTDRGVFVPNGNFQVGKTYLVNIRKPIYGTGVMYDIRN